MVGDIYSSGTTLVHVCDPRAKLFVLVAITVVFFLSLPVWVLAIYLLSLGLFVIAVLGLRELGRPVLTILPILLLVMLLTPPLARGGQTILSPFGFALLTTHGLTEALRMVVRFSGITIAFYLFFRTTSAEHIVLSLRWFGLPFAMCLVITITLRYIPYLAGVYRNITAAHRLRRSVANAQRGLRLFARIRSHTPALTSMLIYAIKRIPVLSMTLESRGVGRTGRRTSYLTLAGGKQFAVHILLALSVIVLLVFSAWLAQAFT